MTPVPEQDQPDNNGQKKPSMAGTVIMAGMSIIDNSVNPIPYSRAEIRYLSVFLVSASRALVSSSRARF